MDTLTELTIGEVAHGATFCGRPLCHSMAHILLKGHKPGPDQQEAEAGRTELTQDELRALYDMRQHNSEHSDF